MGCCDAIMQVLLFIFNFAFFLSGVAVIAVGSYVTANEEDYAALISDGVLQVSILLIVIGCLIVILTFFGCCGAWNQNKCMLYTYSGLLCVIFIAEFAGGIAAFVYRADIKVDVTKQLNSTLVDYKFQDAGDDPTTREWDKMQQTVHCCGVTNYTDWFNIAPIPDPYYTVPDSCCKIDTAGCGTTYDINKPANDIYVDGCVNAAVQEIDDDAVLIGGVAAGLAFLQILGIVLACCLANDAK